MYVCGKVGSISDFGDSLHSNLHILGVLLFYFVICGVNLYSNLRFFCD